MIKAAAAIISLVLLIAAGVVYLPHLGWSNDEVAARQRASEFLMAVVGGREDRGWSLLVDPDQGPYESEAAFRSLMAEADWSAFDWRITNVFCDDGVCTITVVIPAGLDSIPPALRRDEHQDPGVLWVDGAEIGEATLLVLQRGWFGGIGVAMPRG